MTGLSDGHPGREILRLAVYCTDRGQHPPTILGELDLTSTGHLLAGNELMRGSVPVSTELRCVWWEHRRDDRGLGRVQIRCPRCKRHVQWGYGRATDVMRAMGATGGPDDMGRLDVSLVPGVK